MHPVQQIKVYGFMQKTAVHFPATEMTAQGNIGQSRCSVMTVLLEIGCLSSKWPVEWISIFF